MRLGLLFIRGRGAKEVLDVARRAEAAGFDDIWIAEDYFEHGAMSIAGAISTVTSTARIGIGVVNPWTRHPMLTAMETAALGELAPGRVILGVGASNPVWIEKHCGIPFSAPLTAVEEMVTIVREALAGRPVATHGPHFTVDAALSFTPAVPAAPIYVGAKGRQALKLAGQIADGVLLSLLSAPEYVRWAREQTGGNLEMGSYVLTSCAPDRDAARHAIRRDLAMYLGLHGEHDITTVAGLDPELAQRFRSGWLANKPAVDLLNDAIIDTFAVAGDITDCLAGLGRLADAGLDVAVFRDPGDRAVEDLFILAEAFTAGRES